MNEYALDDEGTTGYFLPEDSQRLLTQVCNHVRFLARLGQPRGAEGAREPATEVSRGEWMFCLEQLAEQLDLVLQEVSWPARRVTTMQEATEVSREAAVRTGGAGADDSTQAGEDDFVSGVTLDQIERLNRLISEITAYGDAVSVNGMADFADDTLTTLGHAVFDAASEVGDILAQVEAQQMGKGARPRFSVKEASPAYRLWTPSDADHAPRAVPALAYPLQAYGPRPGELPLH